MFNLKNMFIFGHWKWPAQGTSTVPIIVSAHFRSLLHIRWVGFPFCSDQMHTSLVQRSSVVGLVAAVSQSQTVELSTQLTLTNNALPHAAAVKAIARFVRLSVPWRSCLGCRHAACLQLSHRRPPEMCGLRTRPRADLDPPQFLDRTAIGGGISSRRRRSDTLF